MIPPHLRPYFRSRLAQAALFSSLTITASAQTPAPAQPAPDAGVENTAQRAPEATPARAAAGNPAAEADLERRMEAVEGETPSLPPVPSRLAAPPIASAKPLDRAHDLLALAHRDGRGTYYVKLDGNDEPLTIDGELQDQLTEILRSYQTPYAAVVALDPASGRVLAMAEHSHANPAMRGLTTKAVFPAASVFKLVTATALLQKGVLPSDEECFHGGKHRISEKLLVDSRRDGQCYSLGMALAKSANVIFAKQTLKHLDAKALRDQAQALHFNRALDFEVPTEMSLAAIPDDEFGLATAGSGFGDVFLSPLHGAMLAGTIANGGVWKDPVLLQRDVTSRAGERVMPLAVATELTDMMELTVSVGTARKAFHERGHRVPGAVGKTGSLADRQPFRDYSWFVGFAPRDNPQVAVAAVVVNDPKWRIRAPWLAREAMRLYLEEQQRTARQHPGSRLTTRTDPQD